MKGYLVLHILSLAQKWAIIVAGQSQFLGLPQLDMTATYLSDISAT